MVGKFFIPFFLHKKYMQGNYTYVYALCQNYNDIYIFIVVIKIFTYLCL